MKELKRLSQELQQRFDIWEHYKVYGGQDPTWSDGANMNLVRNHILNLKREIEGMCESNNLELPEVYSKEAPQEVGRDYMARVSEIRRNANIALAEYEANQDYLYLTSVVQKLGKKQVEDTAIENVIGYCRGLKSFIEKDDLVSMRRHENYDRYIQSFKECKKRVEEVLQEKQQEGQISMF